ncbi:MAG: glycerol-3-phosphate 1-O-acyltransferase PlsY [Calditrichaeota bacterium]|nr:glycerol-3-phosphate 1-O-acyltransferase PlsY [Calditrichota bacterium]MCB0268829.1 glycerol-3-phosphate 1-O-acyltransferase PlsY [Calditrichota bacterium]MCB0299120.1 glycerol-3-phosphate 1-O-acyltransferase PlsY [Calditrichota bacterium]MCB9068795.1 glycerol-3-phosphate 1-O-acyltransferase PlsY [Calditrichia bacterium]
MLNMLLMIAISYLMGSIPTSIIAGKLLKGIDIRKEGSGNAGATNVFRVLGWKAGLVVLLIDMLKGWIPTVYVSQLGMDSGLGWHAINYQIIAGISAMFGHIWTIFASFKGGKGVGTGAGMIIGLAPVPVLVCIIVFIVTVWLTRFVSLGSILASITFMAVVFVQKFALNQPVPIELLVFSVFIPVLIIFTHRANVQRLLKGEENKIQFKKS